MSWRLITGADRPLATKEDGRRRWLARHEDHTRATHILIVIHGVRILPLAPGWWQWDGSIEAPTLEPSILCRAADGAVLWHGWFQRGRLVGAALSWGPL